MSISQCNSQKAILPLYFQILGGLCTIARQNRQHYIFSTYFKGTKTGLGIKRVEFGFNL